MDDGSNEYEVIGEFILSNANKPSTSSCGLNASVFNNSLDSRCVSKQASQKKRNDCTNKENHIDNANSNNQDTNEEDNGTQNNCNTLQANKSVNLTDINIQTKNGTLDFVDTNLLKYLENTTRGKEILKEYTDNHKLLPDTTRNKLVRLVIQREKDWTFRDIQPGQQCKEWKITSKRFGILAKEICNIFENESEAVYFTSCKTVNKEKIPAFGKLLHHYDYEVGRLRGTGILAKSTKNKQNKQHIRNLQDIEQLEYLKTNVDDWATVELYWENTYQARRCMLTVDKISSLEYIESFRCLQVQKGLTLIISDFSKLYPDKNIVNQETWGHIKNCTKEHLKNSTVGAQDFGLLHTLLSNAANGDTEDFITFHLLPYIISSQRKKTRNKGKKRKADGDTENIGSDGDESVDRVHKLSIQERRATFILHVLTPGEMQPAVDVLKEKLIKSGQTFQPLIVVVGQVTSDIEYFVLINNQEFQRNTCLEAVALALKVFFVFDCEYPQNSSILWLFIQKCLFNIDLPEDPKNLKLSVLIGHIKSTIRREND